MSTHPTVVHEWVDACRRGDPAMLEQIVARLRSGWAIMGSRQVLRGYCLLLPDPVVPHLNALDRDSRTQFLADFGSLGEAVLQATGALRINYAIFGNAQPALHAHVHPRYADEPAAMRTENPWAYDWQQAPAFDATVHAPIRDLIRRNMVKMEVTCDL
jgi:diadenosine tetraphosphate (Ap4A) HIT family hydrolase